LKKDMSAREYFFPLNPETNEFHQRTVEKCLKANTLFVIPGSYIQASVAAIVAYNFYRLYPNSLCFFLNAECHLPTQIEACHSVGFPETDVTHISAESKRKKRFDLPSTGVIFTSHKTFATFLETDALEGRDVKLLVINGAEKALGHHALTKIVRSTMAKQSHFRVLAMASDVPFSKPAQVQSIISNLDISTIAVQSIDDQIVGQALRPKRCKLHNIAIEQDDSLKNHLHLWRTGTMGFTQMLRSAKVLTEEDPDVLIFSDIIQWTKRSTEIDGALRDILSSTKYLIWSYKHLLVYGYRAFYLYITDQFDKHPQYKNFVEQNTELQSVVAFAANLYGFTAYPTDKSLYEPMKKGHPKLGALVALLEEILSTYDYKIVIFCTSSYAVRSVAEMLSLWNVGKVLENYSHQTVKDCADPVAMIDPKVIVNKFKVS
jgi:ERCC4-related helicase